MEEHRPAMATMPETRSCGGGRRKHAFQMLEMRGPEGRWNGWGALLTCCRGCEGAVRASGPGARIATRQPSGTWNAPKRAEVYSSDPAFGNEYEPLPEPAKPQ
ncbi:hypothetical protein DIPPA_01477 [Diplonema papillatum]|nr:hypothetical protein DIPPA_01477 [Diplonema papillatum]